MLLTFAPLIAGLSTGHQIGLAAVGAAFIVFALISAFLLPRLNPNFPGRGMPIYATVAVLFFVGMLSAVLIFGKESKEATTEPTTTQSAPPPATTTTGGGGATTGTGTTQGDPVAGKAVFTSASCSGCHTLKAAGSTGTTGPNLDQLKPDYAAVVHQVTNGGGLMPAFKGQLTTKQIDDVAAFVFTSTH
jgi:mono/diheme cytochrome c family protein